MFRSLFRVVVVAVVVVGLTLSLAQVAQARPQDSRQQAVGVAAEGGWFEVAVKWIGRLVGDDKPVPGGGQSIDPPTRYGSCIDPLGIERPCT